MDALPTPRQFHERKPGLVPLRLWGTVGAAFPPSRSASASNRPTDSRNCRLPDCGLPCFDACMSVAVLPQRRCDPLHSDGCTDPFEATAYRSRIPPFCGLRSSETARNRRHEDILWSIDRIDDLGSALLNPAV
jgi:hypothetical protein